MYARSIRSGLKWSVSVKKYAEIEGVLCRFGDSNAFAHMQDSWMSY